MCIRDRFFTVATVSISLIPAVLFHLHFTFKYFFCFCVFVARNVKIPLKKKNHESYTPNYDMITVMASEAELLSTTNLSIGLLRNACDLEDEGERADSRTDWADS